MATNIPQLDFQKTALRLPKYLHAQIHAAAQESGRSYNAEIVARLQSSFEPSGDLTHLKETAEAHKGTAQALGMLSTLLAGFVLKMARFFTADQRKNSPEIGVWVAIAEGVVGGEGLPIVKLLEKWKLTGDTDVGE